MILFMWITGTGQKNVVMEISTINALGKMGSIESLQNSLEWGKIYLSYLAWWLYNIQLAKLIKQYLITKLKLSLFTYDMIVNKEIPVGSTKNPTKLMWIYQDKGCKIINHKFNPICIICQYIIRKILLKI